MKKLLGVFIIAFVIAAGFSGAGAAASTNSGPLNLAITPQITIAPNIVIATIINSPGSIVAGGNVVSITGGDTVNQIGSSFSKSTTINGVNGNTINVNAILKKYGM